MAYFIASENLQGKYLDSGNTILIVKYEFEVDTESDLPTQNQFSSDGVKIAMTSTAHVISNNKKFEMQSNGTWSDITTSSGGGGGATVYLTADNIAYDNTTSGLTADDVQEAIDEIVSEMPIIPSTYDADDINYDNTTSGLTATNVQDALDEIVSDIPTIPSTYDADDIVYDNTTSGMTATNVQDAIDELNTDLSGKQDTLTFDNTPTQSSTNPVTSDGIYTALSGKQDTLTFDTAPTASSTNPVTSGGVYTALSGKQDTLIFDNTPTQGSNNPVTSDGIYAAIQGGGGGGSSVDTLHNGCFRGEFLGNTFTAEQKLAIYNGTFDDLYVGDYWTINGVNWRIADIDCFIGIYFDTNDNPITEHHLVIMPDSEVITPSRIQPARAQAQGMGWAPYLSSELATSTLPNTFLPIVNSNFGAANIMEVKYYAVESIPQSASGKYGSLGIGSGKLILPSIYEITGSYFCGLNVDMHHNYMQANNKNIIPKQFALFKYAPKLMKFTNTSTVDEDTYWLRDQGSSGTSGTTYVCNYLEFGLFTNWQFSPFIGSFYTTDNLARGIRPYFLLKGASS